MSNTKTYVGKKIINATPMNRGDYNTLRGWDVPADENPSDEGYLVEYTDGGKANHPGYKGYISWSPKDVFERAYKPLDEIPKRLTIDDLKAKIVSQEFVRVINSTTTLCVLTLANGFVLVGKSACVDKSTFNEEVGKEIAFDDALDQMWSLEGYLLAQRRFEAGLN